VACDSPLNGFTRAFRPASGGGARAGAGARARLDADGRPRLALWLQLPSDLRSVRAQVLPSGGRCSPSAKACRGYCGDGNAPRGRALLTNGIRWRGPTTGPAYMRALAHIPLLSLTIQRAFSSSASASGIRRCRTLHPSVRRRRGRGSLQACPRPCQLFQGCQCRRVEPIGECRVTSTLADNICRCSQSFIRLMR